MGASGYLAGTDRRERALGVQLFASAQDEARARRPTDLALGIASLVAIIITGTLSELIAGFEDSLMEAIEEISGLLDPLWKLAFWAPVVWGAVLVVVALIRHRRTLARDLVAAAVVGVGLVVVIAAIVDSDQSVSDLLLDTNGPPVFPPGALVVATAMLSTASPHLSRPFRHLGRWLILSQLFAAVMLAAAQPTGALAAVAIGSLAASIVHLAVGSPGGRPTASRIVLALRDLGVDVAHLEPATMQPAGVVLFDGTDDDGQVVVKVYGRDAWDAQFLANVWRLMWYRGAERTVRLSRVELVEHEGFVTLLAERAGVAVPSIVTAGSAGRGDALVVVRPLGEPLAELLESSDGDDVDDDAVRSLWNNAQRLHEAGITHGRIDLDRVVVTPDGALRLGDLSSASVAGELDDMRKDLAQVLALSMIVLGEDRAVSIARAETGDEDLVAILPYVQDAAIPPLARDALDDRDIDLDDTRKRLGEILGAGEQDLIKLRRVTWGSLLNLALLAFAAFAVFSLLGDVDLQDFVDELSDADWWWLGFALVLAQIPRFPAAVSTLGSTHARLPLGPLTTLQFAICYINLAIPSTAARVAVNVRFFQRFGVPVVGAMSAGVIDSVAGFVVQILLFLGLFFWSDLDFGIDVSTDDLQGVATIALIALVVIVVACIIVLAVPKLRARLVATLRKGRQALTVLRSPTKVMQLFFGNLISQVLFAVALGACIRAFGYELPLSAIVLVNTVVSLFAGLLPVPGGMGVTEAGLTVGLTAAGLPQEIAFASAIAYRFGSFYLPPVWGFFCYRWLRKRRYL
jgi:uncharacterized membrane protein YbhN (UPF0104 family)/tRNA A-37 threonylcarbamoyl transferase component Bud32